MAAGLAANGDGRAQVITLALVLGALEARTPKDAWRNTTPSWSHHVGSAEYLREHKLPHAIDDLRRHACLRMRRSDGSIAPWSFVNGNRKIEAVVAGPFIANDVPTLLGAAVEGVGLAQVPGPIAAEAVRAGRLVRVLEPFAPTFPGVFLYYPGHRQILPKLRAFIDHVKSRPIADKIRTRTDNKQARRRGGA